MDCKNFYEYSARIQSPRNMASFTCMYIEHTVQSAAWKLKLVNTALGSLPVQMWHTVYRVVS
jgi:hypothetical protein